MKNLQTLLLAASILAATVFPSRAASIIWTNTSGGYWSTAANWDPNQVPATADNAFVTNNGTYAVALDVEPSGVGITVGGASGTQTLSWTGGSIGGSGGWVTVMSNGVLNVSGSGYKQLFGPLTNSGTVIWADSGGWRIFGACYGGSGGIYNLAGGLVDIQNDQRLENFCGWELFNNAGTVHKSAGTGTTQISLQFDNTGTVEADTGVIAFLAGYSNSSSANLATSLGSSTPGSGYGQIQFSSPPAFDGTFSVSTRNSYRPNPGDTFIVLNYPSRTGAFTSMNGLDFGGGLSLQAQFSATSLTLTAVQAPMTNIVVSPSNPSIGFGTNIQFTATGYFSDGASQPLTNAGQVFWTSSNPAIAGINTNGLATGLGNGTTTITATSAGVSGSTVLSVVSAPTRIIGLSGNLAFDTVAVNTTAQNTLTISNSGNASLTVGSINYPGGFSGAWSGSVPAGSSTNVMVTFAPTAATSYGGTVTVNSDATSGTNTITASGTGVPAPTQTVTKIAAGYYQSLFIKGDGSLWAMGGNQYGQLGDGTYNNTNRPEKIAASNVTAIVTLGYHSLFLKRDGSLWAMGDNEYGELGDGTTNDTNLPEQIVASNVTAIAGGGQHSLFLKSDGSLWAMGWNEHGQLGDGTTTSTNRPEQIVTNGVIAVAAGFYHSLFLKSDGSLWGMGYNYDGELGDGTGNSRHQPVQIVASNVTAIAGGVDHSLFLKSDGSLWAMGYNCSGALGDGTDNNAHTPEQIVTNGVTAIAAGGIHSLFLKSDGSLWAMGANNFGQLGDGTYNNTNRPEQIVASNVTAIAAGSYHSLFLKSDGSLWAMGYNYDGELGDGTYNNTNCPEQIVAGPPVKNDVVNFDTLSGGDSGVVLLNYLASFGITVNGVTSGVTLQVATNRPGWAFQASSGQEYLVWGGRNDVWQSFTLSFSAPLTSLSFTRCAEFPVNGATAFPAWSATVYQGAGVVGTAGESAYSIGSPNSSPAQTYNFTGTGITSITFSANTWNFAAMGSPAIDDIIMTFVGPVGPTLKSAVVLPDRSIQIAFSGPESQTYKVWASTDLNVPLASWTLLTNGTFSSSPATFIDTATTNYSCRFYRISIP